MCGISVGRTNPPYTRFHVLGHGPDSYSILLDPVFDEYCTWILTSDVPRKYQCSVVVGLVVLGVFEGYSPMVTRLK